MKPANWRRYFWYRPPALAYPAKSDEQCREMADAYRAWLSETRGWSEEDAQTHIDAMDRRTIIAADQCRSADLSAQGDVDHERDCSPCGPMLFAGSAFRE